MGAILRGASVTALAVGLLSCSGWTPAAVEEQVVAPPAAPEHQEVTIEHGDANLPGALALCETPGTFVPFERTIERQVYDVITAYKTGMTDTLERLTAKTIVEEAERYGLDPWLVVGVIRVESRFYNFAESHKDARGLMQIRPFVGEELAADLGIEWHGAQTLFHPVKNVRMGVFYLAVLNRQFDGNIERALMGYNMGPNRVRRWLRVGRELPTGYADLSREYQGLLAKVARGAVAGADLRSPITAVERSVARRNAVAAAQVAELEPAENGVATATAIPGAIVENLEPAIELDAAPGESAIEHAVEPAFEPTVVNDDPWADLPPPSAASGPSASLPAPEPAFQ